MSDIWSSIKGLIRLDTKKIYIDNIGFRLHYKVTSVILVLFGILVTSRQYFGDPIDCVTQLELVRPIIDNYCWVHGTFTLGEDSNGSSRPNNLVSECIPRELQDYAGAARKFDKDAPRHYATYYQWVWIVLLIQAAFFYAPHWIWKLWEGGRIKSLIGDLNSHVLQDEVKEKHQAAVLQYFKPQSGVHKFYAAKYFICELLCLINLVVQILFTHSFIENRFLKYGIEQGGYNCVGGQVSNQNLPKAFPIVTYCIMLYDGLMALDDVQALCVLPINILNQKIFLFLWFWYAFLFIVTLFGIIYRIITILSPGVRSWRLRGYAKSVDKETINIITRNPDVGDWFFLYELGRNMNPIYFAELLRDLSTSWSRTQSLQAEKSSLLETL